MSIKIERKKQVQQGLRLPEEFAVRAAMFIKKIESAPVIGQIDRSNRKQPMRDSDAT